MVDIGQLSLLIAFAVSLYAIFAFAGSIRSKRQDLIKSGENSVYAVSVLMTIASAALLYAFLSRDFSVVYVYNYSNRDLPIFYTISAFWAGQKGSLLLWAWILSLFSSLALFQNQYKNRRLLPYVMSILMIILCVFTALLAFSTSPFERYPTMPEDGHGLNPMLQNPGMIFHPPSLYLGYVGFSIPFAFAIAALLSGELSDLWIKTTRRWTIISWFFLSVGNLFGAQWAYVELGWGGYWAWDPVENASFMPWLVATAYLHSVMIQEKKDMLKVWNMSLIVLTFALTIFGTFITRSGLIQSVHAFDETTLGYYFLFFLAAVIVSSIILIYLRYPDLKSKNELDSVLSRESFFLFNNLLLLGITFATFWGTIFPIISEAVKGKKITVGPPFYNQVNTPIGLALLLLIGICPLIAWRRATAGNIRKNFLTPAVLAAICGAIMYSFIGRGHVYAWLAFALSIFVLATIIAEFYKGTRARIDIAKEGVFKAFFNLTWKNKRRYGGYIIHIGVVSMFIGIAGSSSYSTEKVSMLLPGESMSIKDYRLTYNGLISNTPYPTKYVVTARLTVNKDGKNIGVVTPEKEFYKSEPQPSSEVAIYSTLKEDLYVILAGYEQDESATFKVLINPLIQWLWIGMWIIAFGTVIAMWPDRAEAARLAARMKRL